MRIVRLRPPRTCRLLPCIEEYAVRALNVHVAEQRAVPACKWKPCHRRRHTDVDSDHSRVEATFDLARRIAVSRKDCRAISVLALLTDGERLIQIRDADYGEHRP